MRLIDADALIAYCNDNWIPLNVDAVNAQPTIQPELTDEQSIAYLKSSGWMQRHDKEMYERGLKEQLADDSDSYDSLLPTVQPEIIRCKDCKYWVIEEDEAYCDLVIVVKGAEDGSGFCSEAKRKMDNE